MKHFHLADRNIINSRVYDLCSLPPKITTLQNESVTKDPPLLRI